jgi:hypothetical protein
MVSPAKLGSAMHIPSGEVLRKVKTSAWRVPLMKEGVGQAPARHPAAGAPVRRDGDAVGAAEVAVGLAARGRRERDEAARGGAAPG